LNIIQSIILGLIQGATEFLPVSSSGHLVIFPYFFNWNYVPLYFTVTVHFATLVAVVTIFYREIFKIVKAVIKGIFLRNNRDSYHFEIGILLILSSIPAAIVGILLNDYIEDFFSEPLAAAGFLIITALIILLGEFRGRRIERGLPGNRLMERSGSNLNQKENPGSDYFFSKISVRKNDTRKVGINLPIALITGMGQALARLPGISRSGATISFARFFGVKRSEAVKFSFLLSVPIIFGSFIFELFSSSGIIFSNGPDIIYNLIAGFISSYVAGLFAVKFIVYLAGKRNLNFFALYCAVLAVAVFAFYVIKKFI
jgi:undecaprenyl-diphosphatase